MFGLKKKTWVIGGVVAALVGTGAFATLRNHSPEKRVERVETLTVEEVNLLREEIKAEFDRRTDILVPEFVAFYNTLNDEQRAKVTERLDKMSNRLERRIEKRAERQKANQAE